VDLLLEQVAGAGEHRSGRLLDPGARRVDQPHHRNSLAQSQLAHARGLQLADHAERPGHHGEVIGNGRHAASVDAPDPGDATVGGGELPLHRGCSGLVMAQKRELGEGAGVEQQVQSFPDRELALPMLALDPFRPTHAFELGALLPKLLGMPSKVRACEDVLGGSVGFGGPG
jgi:hypothetical protein